MLFHAQKPSVSDQDDLAGFVSSLIGDVVAAAGTVAAVGATPAGPTLFVAAAAARSLHASVSSIRGRRNTRSLPVVLFCEPIHLLRLQLFAKGSHADCDAGYGRQCDRKNTSCHFCASPMLVQTFVVVGTMESMTKPVASKKFGVRTGALVNASSSLVVPATLAPRHSNTNDMQRVSNVRMAPERICPGFG